MFLKTFFRSYRNQIIFGFTLAVVTIVFFNIRFFYEITKIQTVLEYMRNTEDPTLFMESHNILAIEVDVLKRTTFQFLIAIVVVGFGGVANLIFVLTTSLRVIMYGIREFARGNIQYRIHLSSKNEFGAIAGFLNEAMGNIEKRTQELEKLRANLERVVEERTEELKDKIAQLEKFQELTVGRELRMVELKKTLARLENKKTEEAQSHAQSS